MAEKENTNAFVLAFDPGETTGWCVMRVAKGALTVPMVSLHNSVWWTTGEINCRNENDGIMRMLDLARQFPGAAIVHEDFIIDMKKIDQARWTLSPVRITAKFEFGLHLIGFRNPFFIQNRSPVKTTCTDDRLKNWRLYDRNSGAHARDATRHAFYFLRNCLGSGSKAAEFRYKAWPHLFADPLAVNVIHARKRKPGRPRSLGERVEGLG